MAADVEREIESLWLQFFPEKPARVFEVEKKEYSLDLSYLPLDPNTIMLNDVASLVNEQGFTKFDTRGLQQRVDNPNGSSCEVPIIVTGSPKQGNAGVGAGLAAAVSRAYAVVGLRNQVKDFMAQGTITFEELQGHVQVLWPFYQTVKFEVYTEGAVQDSNRKKTAGYQPLAGTELNQASWQQHLCSLPPTATVRVVVRAKGRPFSEYNRMADQELQQLVYQHTNLTIIGGKPICDDTWFKPPLGFADGEQLLHGGVAVPLALPAQRSQHALGTSTQHASCPVCCAHLETSAPAGQAHAGQGAQDAGGSHSSGAAPTAVPSDSQHERHSGALKFKHLVTMLANSMVCLLQSLATDELKEEGLHRGFIGLVLSGALMLARSLEPRSIDQRPFLKVEHALAGSMAWGKVDYLLVYRAIGVMVVQAKAECLGDAWGQAFMELCSMREAMVQQLRSTSLSKDKKRSAAEAFAVDKLSTYMLICTARHYRFVLYTPGKGLWWSPIKILPLTAAVTAEQLASPLEDVIKTLAFVLTRQMEWADERLAPFEQLAIPLPESSGLDVEDATKDYIRDAARQQAQEEEE